MQYESTEFCSTTTSAFENKSQKESDGRPLSTLSDSQLLIEYAASGDQDAFEELVRRHERKLFNYLCKFLGDPEMAEDAFQATFLQVHLKCYQFERGRPFAPWLYQIATNQAIDLIRRNRRHKAFKLDVALCGADQGEEGSPVVNYLKNADPEPSEQAEKSEDRKRIWTALEKLPRRLKEVLVLVTYQGLKYREAAARLGIPTGTVKSRAHLAIQTLHRILISTPRACDRECMMKDLP
jgi:RNA polymerase sigma-70 factor, ECF subfamily